MVRPAHGTLRRALAYSRLMLTRWTGWPAAIFVTLLTLTLVLGDLMDAGMRHWWAAHALTTDTVSGLLVLLLTLLVVDQLLVRRQARDRGRAVAAQAAIMVAQAARAGRAVAALAPGPGPAAPADPEASAGPQTTADPEAPADPETTAGQQEATSPADADADPDARQSAADEVRTYMMMLLVGAPVLIEDPVSRRFLEEAQYLGGIMAATLSDRVPTVPAARFEEAVARMRAASKPMLNYLTPNERAAANAEELLG